MSNIKRQSTAKKRAGRPKVDHREVMQLLADGLTMGEVCARVGIAGEAYRMRLMRARKAYGAKTTIQLIAMACLAGDVTIPASGK